jgi:hypothetical protein
MPASADAAREFQPILLPPVATFSFAVAYPPVNRGNAMRRTALVILTIQGLLLLAFSPVWYSAVAGGDQPIVDGREAISAADAPALLR